MVHHVSKVGVPIIVIRSIDVSVSHSSAVQVVLYSCYGHVTIRPWGSSRQWTPIVWGHGMMGSSEFGELGQGLTSINFVGTNKNREDNGDDWMIRIIRSFIRGQRLYRPFVSPAFVDQSVGAQRSQA